MNWKEFLKPDWKRIILFLSICLIIYFIAFHIFRSYINSYFYPLPFAYAGVISGGPGTPVMLTIEYSLPNSLANILIYYLISCTIVRIYEKLKKKTKPLARI